MRLCVESVRLLEFSVAADSKRAAKKRETKEPTSAAGWECSRTATLVESGCEVIARKSWWKKRKGGRAVGEKFMGSGLCGY